MPPTITNTNNKKLTVIISLVLVALLGVAIFFLIANQPKPESGQDNPTGDSTPLPVAFPSTIPLYEGTRGEVTTDTSNPQTTWDVSITTTDDLVAVATRTREAFAAKGFETVWEEQSSTHFTLNGILGIYTVNIEAIAQSDTTQIHYSAIENPTQEELPTSE